MSGEAEASRFAWATLQRFLVSFHGLQGVAGTESVQGLLALSADNFVDRLCGDGTTQRLLVSGAGSAARVAHGAQTVILRGYGSFKTLNDPLRVG